MLYTQILLPVFILVALTFVVLLRGARTASSARAAPTAGGFAPLDALFYVLVALCLPMRHAGWAMVILAWIYVATRVLDVAGLWARVGRVPDGGYVSALVLLVMWVYFALAFLLAF
jgi:hypothetical protein